MNINYTRNQLVLKEQTNPQSSLNWKNWETSTFETSKQKGKMGEYRVDYLLQFLGFIKVDLAEVDLYLGDGYDRLLVDVSDCPKYQKLDIDRILVSSDGSRQSLEIKTDYKARETQNIFFEVATGDRPGWGYKSQADLWVFLIPGQELLMVKPGNFRLLVLDIQLKKEGITERGTRGLLVPITEVRKIACHRVDIGKLCTDLFF